MNFLIRTNVQYSINDLTTELDKLIQSNRFVKENNRTSAYPSILNIAAPKKGLIIGRTETIDESFVGTIFEEIFKKHSPLGNLQIRLLNPEGTYVAHKDPDYRSHIALRTNPHCIITNFDTYESKHVPADGFVYELNARCVHTAINCGSTPRYHLLWSHFRCKSESETPFRFSIEVKSQGPSIFVWQQTYLIDLVIEYETSIQECTITNTADDFSARVYNVAFSDRASGKEFIDKLNILLSTANLNNMSVSLRETP